MTRLSSKSASVAQLAVAFIVLLAIPGVGSVLMIRTGAVNTSELPKVQFSFEALQGKAHKWGLSREDITLNINGEPVRDFDVTEIADMSSRKPVVIVMDNSHSMRWVWPRAVSTVQEYLADMARNHDVAIVTVSPKPTVIMPFTRDHNAAARAIETLNAGGSTALRQAVTKAVTMLAGSPLHGGSVLVVTDGYDTHGSLSARDCIADCGDTKVNCIAFTSGDDRGFLKTLTSRTGGVLLVRPLAHEVRWLCSRMTGGGGNGYRVSFTVAPGAVPGRWHNVELAVSSAGESAKSRIEYYYGPFSASAASGDSFPPQSIAYCAVALLLGANVYLIVVLAARKRKSRGIASHRAGL